MKIDELIENFELLDDWEDKYRYLIDLGAALPPFPPELQTEEWKVSGCSLRFGWFRKWPPKTDTRC